MPPLNEFDISASLGLVLFPLQGEFDPGPRREAKVIMQGVVWLHRVDGKCDLMKFVKRTPCPIIYTLTILLESFSMKVTVISTLSTADTSPHNSDHQHLMLSPGL
jgi:hypothetical protein